MRKPRTQAGARRMGGVSGGRRMATVTVLSAAALLAAGIPAVPAAASAASIDTSPVGFVLTSATCPNLPANTTVTASGVEKSVTAAPARPGGFLVNSTHAQGTATDQAGNRYVFSYSNEFRVAPAADGSLVGLMTDHFSLAGSGPATLDNGFVAHIATDFATFFNFEPITAHGDPISFPSGEAICDPL